MELADSDTAEFLARKARNALMPKAAFGIYKAKPKSESGVPRIPKH